MAPPSSPGDAYNGLVDSVRVNGIGKRPKARLALWHLDWCGWPAMREWYRYGDSNPGSKVENLVS